MLLTLFITSGLSARSCFALLQSQFIRPYANTTHKKQTTYCGVDGRFATLRTAVWLREQADAILHNRFEPSGLRPSAPELRRVVEAMDRLVGRMKEQFEEEIARSERLRREALSDQVTGLPNRRWFDHHLQDVLAADDESAHGALLLLRVTDLDGRNRRDGYARTDQWLREFGQLLTVWGSVREGWTVARLRGADFAVLAPGAEAADAGTLAAGLGIALAALDTTGVSPAARFGLVAYRRGDAPGLLLAQADAALAAAEANGQDWCLPPSGTPVADEVLRDWPTLLRAALESERFVLYGQPVYAGDGSVLHHEVLARLLVEDSPEPLVAGTFCPVAARLGLAADLGPASVNRIDPGACSCALLLGAAVGALEAGPGPA